MTDQPFESRLGHLLQAYADAGIRPVDRSAVARSVLAGATRSRGSGPGPWRRWFMPVLAGMLVLGLAIGSFIVASPPRTDPQTEVRGFDGPVASNAPERPEADGIVGVGPCAAMVQQFMNWSIDDIDGPITGRSRRSKRENGDILFPTPDGYGGVTIGRLDPSRSPPALVGLDAAADRPLPRAPGYPIRADSRIVPSADGRAVAVEEGDLGVAGCGDPVVLLADGGIRRPFPVGAFELVSDPAWAPDGSALYAVRRPTIDAGGDPIVDEDSGRIDRGPGVVLRWDTKTAAVTEIGAPCAGCPVAQVRVSPDGTRLAMIGSKGPFDSGDVVIRDRDGTWRTIADDAFLVGWADDDAVVTYDLFDAISVVATDGESRAAWSDPCCHGTGFGSYAVLSPDGTTLAGMTLSNDFESENVTLLDVRDGSSRDVWGARTRGGCESMSKGRGDCAALDPDDLLMPSVTVAAWAPDGSAVVVVERSDTALTTRMRIVRTDGSGTTPPVTVSSEDDVPILTSSGDGMSVAWMPG